MKLKTYDRIQCETMLSAAANASLGFIVRTNSTAMQARALLYEYRKGNPGFSSIQIRFSPTDPDNDLWLIHNAAGSEPEPEPAPNNSTSIGF